MVDVQTISVVIAAASVVIGVVIGVAQLRDLKRMRQDELFMPIYARFYEREFDRHWVDIQLNWEWKDYDDFMEKYGPDQNIEAYSSLLTVAGFLHTVGTLLMRKRIDPTLVDNLIRNSTIQFWEKIEPIVKESRKRIIHPRWLFAAEYLYDEMKRRAQLELKT